MPCRRSVSELLRLSRGKGAQAKPGFILGLDPRDKKTVTTSCVIPTVRDTFKDAGIAMATYDALPNYWKTSPHNIRKRTERTRSCEVCHDEKKDFLTKEMLIKNGSKANESLIYAPKPLKSNGGKKAKRMGGGFMRKIRFLIVFFVLSMVGMIVAAPVSQARDVPPVVSADWLEKNLGDPLR